MNFDWIDFVSDDERVRAVLRSATKLTLTDSISERDLAWRMLMHDLAVLRNGYDPERASPPPTPGIGLPETRG